jgi:hypothetical protein
MILYRPFFTGEYTLEAARDFISRYKSSLTTDTRQNNNLDLERLLQENNINILANEYFLILKFKLTCEKIKLLFLNEKINANSLLLYKKENNNLTIIEEINL